VDSPLAAINTVVTNNQAVVASNVVVITNNLVAVTNSLVAIRKLAVVGKQVVVVSHINLGDVRSRKIQILIRVRFLLQLCHCSQDYTIEEYHLCSQVKIF
jgi:hypothetical protein